jgi:hypothetical protein
MLENFDEYKDINENPSVLHKVTFEQADGRYVISVGSARIDVETALREVRHLSGNVIGTAGDAWGYPSATRYEPTTDMAVRILWGPRVADNETATMIISTLYPPGTAINIQ